MINKNMDIDALLRRLGVRLREAQIIREVHSAVSEWPTVFSSHDVPAKDGETIGRDITQRLKNGRYTITR